MSAVSIEEVLRVAELANLQLTSGEEISLQRDLNAILAHVAQLAELDTTHIEPQSQGRLAPLAASQPDEAHGATLRPDTLRASLDRRPVLAAAPESDGRFFKVPKVIER